MYFYIQNQKSHIPVFYSFCYCKLEMMKHVEHSPGLIFPNRSEPCFDTLRTKEQLGYAVYSMLRNTYGILGISITVNSQATKFSADHVNERIESFLTWFLEHPNVQRGVPSFNLNLTKLPRLN